MHHECSIYPQCCFLTLLSIPSYNPSVAFYHHVVLLMITGNSIPFEAEKVLAILVLLSTLPSFPSCILSVSTYIMLCYQSSQAQVYQVKLEQPWLFQFYLSTQLLTLSSTLILAVIHYHIVLLMITGTNIPSETEVSLDILVLSLNSALNSFLYSLSCFLSCSVINHHRYQYTK